MTDPKLLKQAGVATTAITAGVEVSMSLSAASWTRCVAGLPLAGDDPQGVGPYPVRIQQRMSNPPSPRHSRSAPKSSSGSIRWTATT